MSKVTSKLQVTLPKVIAAAHNIRPGSEIHFESGIDCIRIVVGGTRSELPINEKLRLLTEANTRQRERNKQHRASRKQRIEIANSEKILTTVAQLIDTNILINRVDPRFPEKQEIVTKLLEKTVQNGEPDSTSGNRIICCGY